MTYRKCGILFLLVVLVSLSIQLPQTNAQGGDLTGKAYNEWSLVETRHIDVDVATAVQTALPDYIFDRRAAQDAGRVASRIVHTSLAPNGNTILVALQLGDAESENKGGMCFYTIDTQAIACHILVDHAYFESELLLRWSPDGRYVIFYTDFVTRQRNSDLWLFDTETARARNLTPDDNPEARWGSPEALAGNVYFDGAVVWQADSQSFYFWRYHPVEGGLNTSVMQMNIGDGVASEVVLLADIQQPMVSNPRQVALSADGTQLAFVTYPQPPNQPSLWVLNLSTLDVRELITGRELKTIWNDDKNLLVQNVQWQGENLLVYLDRDSFVFVPEYILLNPDTLALTTMIEIGVQRTNDTLPYFDARAVRWGGLSADGSVLVYFSEGSLFTMPTTLEGEPHLLGEFAESLLYEPSELYRVTPNGRLLLNGVLFQFE